MAKENPKSKTIHYDDYPLLRHIQENVIGQDLVLHGAFGPRKVVYCDFTASGRCLSFIEDYIRNNVLPVYANTHSVTGFNATQTGQYRSEARQIIKKCMNAGRNDVLIFTGSGATSAFHKLAWALKLNLHRVAEETVVIVGPYEHHSNTLLWREYGTQGFGSALGRPSYVPHFVWALMEFRDPIDGWELVRIREDDNGYVDMTHLEEELKFWKEKRQHLLVAMSAASNVTGILTDTDAVAEMSHRYGALVVFDYAAGGPYLEIDVNSSEKAYKDGVIVSTHKFVGGPGTPGLLLAKKWVFRNSIPDRVGGGTVDYVSRQTHVYKKDIEEREEGGTPDIIGCIRAAIVFKLKQDVGTDVIHFREEMNSCKAFQTWKNNPCICVLGSQIPKRLPIFSFLTIHQETGKLIHHNFISMLLNDLFGIQSRGGCACAGPYGHDLMGISEGMSRKLKSVIVSDIPKGLEKNGHGKPKEVMKPGFTRINLPYFYDDSLIQYIIDAIDMVTRHGWKLLPRYTFDWHTGVWYKKESNPTEISTMGSLRDLNFNKKDLLNVSTSKLKKIPGLKDTLRAAQKIFKDTETYSKTSTIAQDRKIFRDPLSRDKVKLRWFLTPDEAFKIMESKDPPAKRRYKLPFRLKHYNDMSTTDGNSTHRSTASNGSKTSSNVFADCDVCEPSLSKTGVLSSRPKGSTLKKRFYSDSDVFENDEHAYMKNKKHGRLQKTLSNSEE